MIFNRQRIERSLPSYARAIENKCSVLPNCVGFIDGTNREISRPLKHQGVYYSGHKHYHCFKFQSWVTPDGLISSIFGPVPGHRHDLYLFSLSRLEEDVFSTTPFNSYCLFGDQGYHNKGHLLAPIPGLYLTEAETHFNECMLEPRLAVEWGFMRVSQLWQCFSKPVGLRAGNMSLGQMYLVSVLLTNIRTCMHKHNQISTYFELEPCSPEEYLS